MKEGTNPTFEYCHSIIQYKLNKMKKIFFIAIAIFLFNTAPYSQIKVPTIVSNSFKQKFPSAINAEWEKEGKGEFEVTFEKEGKKCTSNFNSSGKWLETESPIRFDELPLKIQNSFSKVHKKEDVRDIFLIETSNGTRKFEIEYKKGSKIQEIIYSNDGIEMKK